MIKYKIPFAIILVIIFFISCNDKSTNDYSTGIAKCTMINELINKGDKSLIQFYGKPLCLVGYQMPEFQAQTIFGKSIDINYFKGKITILYFWFSGCAPCIAEIPGFNKIVEKYGREKVNYLGIRLDHAKDIDTFLQKHTWAFEQIGDGENLVKDIFKIEWGFPTTFIVDTNAIIIDAFSGGRIDSLAIEELVDRIETIIGKVY